MLMKATVELLLDIPDGDEGAAADGVSSLLSEQMAKYAPGSCLIDWQYAGMEKGYAAPDDGMGFTEYRWSLGKP